jgi:hypothetical protein
MRSHSPRFSKMRESPDRVALQRGLLIGCEMMLEAADQDPIAARLLTNLLNHLAEG